MEDIHIKKNRREIEKKGYEINLKVTKRKKKWVPTHYEKVNKRMTYEH